MSSMFLSPWEQEPLEKKYQEPEPSRRRLGKKIGSRSRLEKIQEPEPEKKLASSSALV